MRTRTEGSLTFVLDENLSGHRIIQGLIDNGIPAKAQTDLMARGLPDEEVLSNLSNYPDYFLLTKDSDFHKKPLIRAAIIQHGIGAFVITAHKGKTAEELVNLITLAWHRIQKFANNHKRPFTAKITAEGRVEAVEDRSETPRTK